MTHPIQYAVPDEARHYSSAASFSASRLLFAMPVALLGAAVVGAAYGWFEHHVRAFLLRVAVAGAVAVAMGLITVGMVHASRLHRRMLAGLLGALVGIVGLWVCWIFYVARTLDLPIVGGPNLGPKPSLVNLILDPIFLYRLADFINTFGTWSYRGNTVRGVPLLVCWIGEAVILVGVCTWVAAMAGKPGLFCPGCGKRCKQISGLGRFNGAETEQVGPRLKAGDFDHLLALGPIRDDDDPEVRLQLFCCPCGQTNVLGAKLFAWVYGVQGGQVLLERSLLDDLLLSPEQVEQVRGLKARLPDPEDPQRHDGAESDEALDDSEDARV